MAISTVKISDTMTWAKRLSFNRFSGIGNSLEPALTSANHVMQTVLGPPFTWWWNNLELSFTCNPVLGSNTVLTNVVVVAGIATITVANTYVPNSLVLPSNVVSATFLNGQMLTVLTASATQFTAAVNVQTYATHADTGTLTSVTTQDYTVVIPNFSHIEHASVYDIGQTPSKWYEMDVKNTLALDSILGRPQFLSPHTEDASGNVTFRLMPAPDLAYPVTVHIQQSAPEISSLNATWAPIPDYMQYVYDWGFLALMWAFADDPRFTFANQKFTAGLLGRAQGLTEEERNIFLNNWNNLTGLQNMQTQQGVQARGQ